MKLAIKHKNKISSMLFQFLQFTKEIICSLSLPHFSLSTLNTVTHGYDTSAVLPDILFDEDRQKTEILFKVSTIILLFALFQNIMCKILEGINISNKCTENHLY